MAEILLINRNDIMRLTGVKGTVDMDKILPHIKTGQDIQLQTMIGTKLLDKCKTLVEDGTLDDSGNEHYKELIEEKIAPVLVFYAMVEYVPFATFEMSNAGISRHTPENTTPLDMDEVDKLAQKFRDKAEFYSRRLEDYLCANSTNFPEYTQADSQDMNSAGASPFHGWVM